MRSSRASRLVALLARLVRLRWSKHSDAEIEAKRAVFACLSELGGVYLKFLQVMALSADFLKGWAGPAEYAVFESEQFDPLDIHSLLERELGAAGSAQYAEVSEVPFAAGSFAQVYRGRLLDGQEVAIKVLRPSLARTLRSDLRLLKWAVRIATWIRPSNFTELKVLFQDFAASALEETDYRRELRNTLWFADYFRTTPEIAIPTSYPNLSSATVLTQGYIGGVSLASLMAEVGSGADPERLVAERLGSDLWVQLEHLGTAIVHATLWADFLLGDPHPGNIKLLPDNRIGLIDFGLVATSPPDRGVYLGFLEAYRAIYEDRLDPGVLLISILQFLDTGLARSLRVLEESGLSADVLSRISSFAGERFLRGVTGSAGAEALRSKRVVEIFQRTINDGNRYGLRYDPRQAALLKSARAYILTLRYFSRGGEEERTMRSILYRETEVARAHPERFVGTESPSPKLEQALEVVGEWLMEIAERDPSLFLQLGGMMKRRYYV